MLSKLKMHPHAAADDAPMKNDTSIKWESEYGEIVTRKCVLGSDPIAGFEAKRIIHAFLCPRSDALVLSEAALDNLVGRQALRLERCDLNHGVLTKKHKKELFTC